MDALPQTEREEYQHFINVVYAFISYKRDGAVDAERIYRSLNLLSKDDKELLKEPPAARVLKILQALVTNQNFISAIFSCLTDEEYFTSEMGNENPDDFRNHQKGSDGLESDPLLKELRRIVRNSIFCKIPPEIEDCEILPTRDPIILARNMNWVRTTLRQFVRDWSEEGAAEREQTFKPLLDALKRWITIENPENPPRVLCPGSGLGRLPFEVLNLGYSSQGNEFSYFMLIGSNFIINHIIKPNSLKFYPYCLSTSNRVGHDDQLCPVYIPDVCAAEVQNTGRDFSMCAGEFTEVYDQSYNEFDAVLTCFFLDTAKNVISYVRTIAKIVKQGGLWANIGPLLYHYADFNHNSIELSWEELKMIILKWFIIENVEWKEAYYTSNSRSMMKTQYNCVYFEAIRNDVAVFGKSNPF